MQPEIIETATRRFVGARRTMSFTLNSTGQLWAEFMPSRKLVSHTVSNELYSFEIYPENFFAEFDPTAEFEKWAAVEVSDVGDFPPGLELFRLPAGKYAVFFYLGHLANAAGFYQKIFTEWLPENGLELDARPHFAVMGDRYKNDSDDSEEEIWIPVKS